MSLWNNDFFIKTIWFRIFIRPEIMKRPGHTKSIFWTSQQRIKIWKKSLLQEDLEEAIGYPIALNDRFSKL